MNACLKKKGCVAKQALKKKWVLPSYAGEQENSFTCKICYNSLGLQDTNAAQLAEKNQI